MMTREEQIQKISALTLQTLMQNKEDLYTIADELGITYRRTKCMRCTRDLWNIIREQLGLIESAADASAFN